MQALVVLIRSVRSNLPATILACHAAHAGSLATKISAIKAEAPPGRIFQEPSNQKVPDQRNKAFDFESHVPQFCKHPLGNIPEPAQPGSEILSVTNAV